jgi:Protein of unknown function (DUF2630)
MMSEETKLRCATRLHTRWGLLRQRRALREFAQDPAQAKVRSAEVVRRILG